jgi:uncharacterized protein
VKAVLDTNVLLSGFFWKGAPHTCILAAESGLFELIYCDEILSEMERVVNKKFPRTKPRFNELQNLLFAFGRKVRISGKLKAVLSDPNDDMVVECAVLGEAEVIVSGDRHLLCMAEYQGIKIVTPASFLQVIFQHRERR